MTDPPRGRPMHHALIVARMAPQSAPDIAKVFAASDSGELPHLVCVTQRSLFQFGDVYLHFIESEGEPGPAIAKVTEHPAFRDISDKLSAYVSPFPAGDGAWMSAGDAAFEGVEIRVDRSDPANDQTRAGQSLDHALGGVF